MNFLNVKQAAEKGHNDIICTVEIKTHESQIKKDNGFQKRMGITKKSTTESDKRLIEKLESLPVEYWDFKSEETREYTHGIHSYPAMMVCPISRNIINIVKQTMPVHSLFDPFTGSGTVLVEGMLANIETIYGNDINPLALFLSETKTTRLNIDELQQESILMLNKINAFYHKHESFFEMADFYISNHFELDLTDKKGWGADAPKYLAAYIETSDVSIKIPSFKNIGYWFKPRVILLLQLIKDSIMEIEEENIRRFVLVAFSETIRLVSNRRNGEFKMFRMKPEKVAVFTPNVINEFTTILNRNIAKMSAFNKACVDNGCVSDVTIFRNNATSLQDVPDDSVDLVITSPPYGDSRTTVAYGEYSRLSLQWLDLDNLTEKQIMGIDKSLMGGTKYRDGFEYSIPSETLRKSLDKIKDLDLERAGDVYSFYLDLEHAIGAIANKSRHGGYQFWVVGNRTVKGEVLLTDKIIAEIAENYKMDYVYTINRNIVNKVMPSLNSPTNETGQKSETMTNEHIVILRKK